MFMPRDFQTLVRQVFLRGNHPRLKGSIGAAAQAGAVGKELRQRDLLPNGVHVPVPSAVIVPIPVASPPPGLGGAAAFSFSSYWRAASGSMSRRVSSSWMLESPSLKPSKVSPA